LRRGADLADAGVRPIGLVVFDLDGTLLRGPTVCEVLAEPLRRLDEARQFERASTQDDIAVGRAAMAGWYRGVPMSALLSSLESAEWAPGAAEGIATLRRHRIEVAIASITWRFAVGWFAQRLGVRWHLGTDLMESGDIAHVWPADKGPWLRGLATALNVPADRVAAVGDSRGDIDLLRAASLRVFVGVTVPADLENVEHFPQANMGDVATRIVEAWTT
jgi:phosphoserine phosphatase